MMESAADGLLNLRYLIGYPAMVAAGFVCGALALGRVRTMTNGRRRLYRALVSAAFALSWTGVWGVFGVSQYGQYPTPIPVVSISFSIGIVWIGISLATIAILVLVDEYQHSGALNGNRNHG